MKWPTFTYTRTGFPFTVEAWRCEYCRDYATVYGHGRTRDSARLDAEIRMALGVDT